MKTYKLTRPFDDGTVVHKRGTILELEVAPSSAKEISAKEIAAEKAAASVADNAIKAAERAELKAEMMAELRAELLEEALAEAKAANAAAAATVTGGVDNDGKSLDTVTTGKNTPVQKAAVK